MNRLAEAWGADALSRQLAGCGFNGPLHFGMFDGGVVQVARHAQEGDVVSAEHSFRALRDVLPKESDSICAHPI